MDWNSLGSDPSGFGSPSLILCQQGEALTVQYFLHCWNLNLTPQKSISCIISKRWKQKKYKLKISLKYAGYLLQWMISSMRCMCLKHIIFVFSWFCNDVHLNLQRWKRIKGFIKISLWQNDYFTRGFSYNCVWWFRTKQKLKMKEINILYIANNKRRP